MEVSTLLPNWLLNRSLFKKLVVVARFYQDIPFAYAAKIFIIYLQLDPITSQLNPIYTLLFSPILWLYFFPRLFVYVFRMVSSL